MSAMPGHTHPEIEDRVVVTIRALFKEQTALIEQKFDEQKQYIDKRLERLLEDIEGKIGGT